MTFDSNMEEVQQDAVPEIYDIKASGYIWRYTSYRTNLTFLSNVYKAAAIKRSGFSMDRDLGSARVTLNIPFTAPLSKYLSVSPLPSTQIIIYRATLSDLTSYAQLFDGIVDRVSIADKMVAAECRQSRRLKVRLPNIVHQSYCNWQVFDCDCSLLAENWEVPATVNVSGSVLSSPAFALFADGYFIQGWVTFDGDTRFVTNHVGSDLTLQIPFASNLVNGSAVLAYPGCDGSPSTCRDKFDNFSRLLSMPYIPSHNPVIWGFK